MSARFRLVLGYGIPLGILTLFTLIASYAGDGGFTPDASPFRVWLYLLSLLILPVGYAAFFIHLAIVSLDRVQRRIVLWWVAVGGLIGPVVLGWAIARSDDGEAMMGIIAIPLCYAIAAVAIAMVVSLCLVMRKRILVTAKAKAQRAI